MFDLRFVASLIFSANSSIVVSVVFPMFTTSPFALEVAVNKH